MAEEYQRNQALRQLQMISKATMGLKEQENVKDDIDDSRKIAEEFNIAQIFNLLDPAEAPVFAGIFQKMLKISVTARDDNQRELQEGIDNFKEHWYAALLDPRGADFPHMVWHWRQVEHWYDVCFPQHLQRGTLVFQDLVVGESRQEAPARARDIYQVGHWDIDAGRPMDALDAANAAKPKSQSG